MAEKELESALISSGDTTAYTAVTAPSTPIRRRVLQNYVLVWMRTGHDEANEDCERTVQQLRTVISDVSMFADLDACVDFIEMVTKEKVYVIVSGALAQDGIRLMHGMTQIDVIYVLCTDRTRHEALMREGSKVKGVFTALGPVCDALRSAIKRYNRNSTPISYMQTGEDASSANPNQLEASFMYTKLFKDTLLTMQHDEQACHRFIQYCRSEKADVSSELELIKDFEQNYRANMAIQWYTRDSFIYVMINRALRLLEADIIMKMGFFLCDLHQQITQKHQLQVTNYDGKRFTLWRGQGITTDAFAKMSASKGGLLAFNSYISTSKSRDVSFLYAESSAQGEDIVGVLFVMSIDPNIDATPFADIQDLNVFDEPEALFSMHSVFRIGEIAKIKGLGQIFEVNLTLTSEHDPQLLILTQRLYEESVRGNQWGRMGNLLIMVGALSEAENLYQTLIDQTSEREQLTVYTSRLGTVKFDQGDYQTALTLYQKAIEMRPENISLDDPSLGVEYSNIALAYNGMGEHSRAIDMYKKALDLQQRASDVDRQSLANTYSNSAIVYYNTEEYSQALESFEIALAIREKVLPKNHPDIAASHNNIGMVHYKTRNFEQALERYQTALDIQTRTLPRDHPSLASVYNNMAAAYDGMKKYSKAMEYYERALNMEHGTLPLLHPNIATSYSNIARVYENMKDNSAALTFYDIARIIREKTLPQDHHSLATTYRDIAGVHDHMNEYPTALSFYEKVHAMQKKVLPPKHQLFVHSYVDIGLLYRKWGRHAEALVMLQLALEILQDISPPRPSDVQYLLTIMDELWTLLQTSSLQPT